MNKEINMEELENVFEDIRKDCLSRIGQLICTDINERYHLNPHASLEVLELNIKKHSRDLFGKIVSDDNDIFKITDEIIKKYYTENQDEIFNDFKNILTVKSEGEETVTLDEKYLFKKNIITHEKKRYGAMEAR